MNISIITQKQIGDRISWIEKLNSLRGDFRVNSEKIENELKEEIAQGGLDCLLGHLRLCGAIPESYGHDTSEEKLYSKYTDIVIHEAYKALGCNSLVLKERADVADVECTTNNYSFVADAKSFRLSRTAKNQKDFKVQSMDRWKHGKPYAMVVCPVYHLPTRSSQIYHQAISREVNISTYTHLAVLVKYASIVSKNRAIELLHKVFQSTEILNPSKNAQEYWQTINRSILSFDDNLREVWREEKIAAIEAVYLSRENALSYFAKEQEKVMNMSKEQAINTLLKASKIASKIDKVTLIADNGLLNLE